MSVLGAELIAFGDMSDVSYALKSELDHLGGSDTILINLFTERKTLFNVDSKKVRA